MGKKDDRQENPLIRFEPDNDRNPVLVKENGERITSAEHSDRFNQTG